MSQAYFTGLALGFSLIVAIGAQNAFVLRQGLKGEHVFPVCLLCSVSDAVLIFFGVIGFQAISARYQWLEPALRYGGAAFLIWYGALSLRSALRSSAALGLSGQNPATLGKTLAICLALTWLNPHVYIDTVVMMGMLSANYPGYEKVFASGAASASLIFFFSLGYGAQKLRPLFANPKAWRVFEVLIAALMWFLAFKLLKNG